MSKYLQLFLIFMEDQSYLNNNDMHSFYRETCHLCEQIL